MYYNCDNYSLEMSMKQHRNNQMKQTKKIVELFKLWLRLVMNSRPPHASISLPAELTKTLCVTEHTVSGIEQIQVNTLLQFSTLQSKYNLYIK